MSQFVAGVSVAIFLRQCKKLLSKLVTEYVTIYAMLLLDFKRQYGPDLWQYGLVLQRRGLDLW